MTKPVLLVGGPLGSTWREINRSLPCDVKLADERTRAVHRYRRVRPADETALLQNGFHALYEYESSETLFYQ